MLGMIRPLSPPSPGWGRIVRHVGRLMLALDLALQVRCERRMLLSMDDRALKDIGLNGCDVETEVHRSFWDFPVDRLRL